MSAHTEDERGTREEAVVVPRLVRPVSFRGYDFDADRVVAVDPVATHSTGNLSCDWKYGVKLRLEGAEIVILSPKDPDYGWAGNKTTRNDLIRDAKALREELLKIIWPNDQGEVAATSPRNETQGA